MAYHQDTALPEHEAHGMECEVFSKRRQSLQQHTQLKHACFTPLKAQLQTGADNLHDMITCLHSNLNHPTKSDTGLANIHMQL